jgi:hypothetical protein
MRGFIQDNPSIFPTVSNNGASAINIVVDGTGKGVVTVDNNVVTANPSNATHLFDSGLRGGARGGNGGEAQLKFLNNSVVGKFENEFFSGNNTPGESILTCVLFSNNTVDGNAGTDYLLTQYGTNVFQIQGLNVSGTNAAAVNAFVAATDADPSAGDPVVDSQGGLVVNYTNGTCASP